MPAAASVGSGVAVGGARFSGNGHSTRVGVIAWRLKRRLKQIGGTV
jgi:hypothetical protein